MRSTVTRTLFGLAVCGVLCASAWAGDPQPAAPVVPQPAPAAIGGWDAGVVIVRHVPTGVEGWQGGWQPGGYEGRIGRPYYYSAYPNGAFPWGSDAGVYGPQGPQPMPCGDTNGNAVTPHPSNGPWVGGGWYANGWWGPQDPYLYHFGPGYYRHSEYGHIRFPYYSYRRPWYFPGHPVYNRDTNFAW